MLARGVGEVKGLAVRTLPRLVGIQRAARLIYTREQVSGARAAEIGLYDEAAPAAQIRTRAVDLAPVGAAAPVARSSATPAQPWPPFPRHGLKRRGDQPEPDPARRAPRAAFH